MKSRGKNDDLLDQMKGVSTQYGQKHNSLLVSTSAMEAGAIKWAETQMKNSQAKKSIYVYKIRADANYFIVFESLMNAFGQTEDKESEDRAKVAKVRYVFSGGGGGRAGASEGRIISESEHQKGRAIPHVSYSREGHTSFPKFFNENFCDVAFHFSYSLSFPFHLPCFNLVFYYRH